MNKNKKMFIIFLYKILIYFILYASFIGIFALRNIALQNISRTFAIATIGYIGVGIFMLRSYSNFDIGNKKSKPVIYEMVLATVLTNISTYLIMMIMAVNPINEQANNTFRLDHLDLLLIVLVVHLILVYVATYLGNSLYFRLFDPVKTLIIGEENEECTQKVLHMMKRHKLQYDVQGVISQDDAKLKERVLAADYVVFLNVEESLRHQLVNTCYVKGINFAFAPSITNIIEASGSYTIFDDHPMVDVNVDGLSAGQKLIKRILDLAFALILGILSAPIWILCAIAVKLGDGGKVIFKQPRATINGRVFYVYKFRSMKENVANYSATQDDDRITKVGRVLRKLRIDELPQLLNILKGDMSVVGPRPEMIENVEHYEKELPEFRYRLKVKAGLTGMAQIEGKYNSSPEDKLKMDLVYIENYSIWQDLKLILRTAVVLFKKDSIAGFGEEDSKNANKTIQG